jgi:hypothetical protein
MFSLNPGFLAFNAASNKFVNKGSSSSDDEFLGGDI